MAVNWFNLIFSSILLGVGLAMDAFSVSLANGLTEPKMKLKKAFLISGLFAFFQALMPLIGWVAISGFLELFNKFKPFIPWISFILLCFIGGKMLFDSFKKDSDENETIKKLTFGALFIQAIATSIDALSVGFTIAEHTIWEALLSCAIIGILTFAICLCGILIGRKMGTKLANKAGFIGGTILIIIGLEIFITNIF